MEHFELGTLVGKFAVFQGHGRYRCQVKGKLHDKSFKLEQTPQLCILNLYRCLCKNILGKTQYLKIHISKNNILTLKFSMANRGRSMVSFVKVDILHNGVQIFSLQGQRRPTLHEGRMLFLFHDRDTTEYLCHRTMASTFSLW